MMIPWVVPFHSLDAIGPDALSIAGGKGANLARLAQAGLPVPEGFIISTSAYQVFVKDNQLKGKIAGAIAAINPQDPAALEAASAQIREQFAQGKIPGQAADEIRAAYRALGSHLAVAVRSSATAEDLPEMSFAGQQDTYLNVVGEEALVKAVVQCWSSLWTARAIGYRARNGIDQGGVALAVAVQLMVESESSGVLFTANPLTGLRSETVIDATLGLGEALVSGMVEPDHYVVALPSGQITEKMLGAKAVSIHGQAGGGTQQVAEARQEIQALPDEQIVALARMGQAVAAMYGQPQDIEWAWAGGRLYLLQSRAITSLYPTPDEMPVEPLQVLYSFAAVQGMMAPMTPLGRDAIRVIFAMGQRLFGIVPDPQNPILPVAGERLWIRATPLLRNSVGRQVSRVGLEVIEPTIRQAVLQIWDDPRLLPKRKGISLRALGHLLRFFPRLAWNVLLNLINPGRRRTQVLAEAEDVLALLQERCAAVQGTPRQRLTQQAVLLPDVIAEHLPATFLKFVSIVAAGMASFVQLDNLVSKNLPAGSSNVLEVTRGLAYNPTTEMDLDLWEVAKAIRADSAAYRLVASLTAQELGRRYCQGDLPATVQQAVGRFLDRYGRRGLGEIDAGSPRWVEDPAHIFEVLGGYIQIEPGPQAPDIVFARSREAGQAALEQIVGALGKQRGGWFKARLARFLGGRARSLMGARESPKFFAVRMLGQLRAALLATGQDLVQAGEMAQADDLFYLSFAELSEFATSSATRDWRSIIAARRESYNRERLRRQIPRVLLSDGRAFYEGMAGEAASGNGLHGSPVSPGVVEGQVRVVLDPRQAGLLPGEILVCPGTDPSWTPLFLTAGGLIMEVGGMMTHGAVVAREYGIPAVVGVDRATTRLQTGERIRLDGSSGQIERIEG